MENRTKESKKLSEWNMLMWLGQMTYEDGKYKVAELKFKRALNCLEELNIKDQRLASNLNGLALCYCAQGNHKKSDALYKKAIEIDEAAADFDKAATTIDFNNLATHYRDQGLYEKAEPLYQKALSYWEKNERSPEIASVLTNLGLMYCQMGQCGVGESFFRKSLSMELSIYGRDSREYAQTAVNLASNLCMQGKCEEAEPFFEEGIRKLGYQIGPRPELADALELYLEYLEKTHQETKKIEKVSKSIDNLRKKKR
ncbi:MAG: tetratricopeptide repeat protein [Cyanobacteria bacterium HKST-UBA01]|nr:tetratricopeptide repeat protein [Cyanobacteria bacterium HKST-UBA01]